MCIRHSATLALFLVAAALVTGTDRVWAVNDVITMVKGPEQKGTVQQDTVDGVVVVQVGGGNMTFKSSEVKSIEWDIQNAQFQRGIAEMNRGGYDNAAAEFQVIASDPDEVKNFREAARPYLFFALGECLFKAGKGKDAVEIFEKLVADYKTSRYVPLAVDRLVDLYVQMKIVAKVPPLLEKLKSLGGEFKTRAIRYDAKMDLDQGKLEDADRKFEEVSRSTEDAEIKALARLGQADIANRKKEQAKAKQMAEQALASSSAPAVAAAAHLIVGDALTDESEKEKADTAKEKLLDAALEYFRIPVQYPGDPNQESEALFKAGECFRRLAKFPDRVSDKGRAATLYTQVIEKYRNSSWAGKAQESMKLMR